MDFKINWHVEKRKINVLIPHPDNPRKITKEKLEELKTSLEEIGYAQDINIDLDNTILSGHARYYVLKEENPDIEIDVKIPNRKLTKKERNAVLLRMNKNITGEWDWGLLVDKFDVDILKDVGFTDFEIGQSKTTIDVDDFEDTETKTKKDPMVCPQCGFEL